MEQVQRVVGTECTQIRRWSRGLNWDWARPGACYRIELHPGLVVRLGLVLGLELVLREAGTALNRYSVE